MRGRKTTYYDGGHRAACFVRWPTGGLGKPRDVDALTQVQDLLPTLLDLCGTDAAEGGEVRRHQPRRTAARRRRTHCPTGCWSCSTASSRPGRSWRSSGRACCGTSGGWSTATELYDLTDRPGPADERGRQAPRRRSSKLRDHYETWWTERRAADSTTSCRSCIGADEENPVTLSSADWANVYCDNMNNLRTGSEARTARGTCWSRRTASTRSRCAAGRRRPTRRSPPACRRSRPSTAACPQGKALPIAKARLEDRGPRRDEAGRRRRTRRSSSRVTLKAGEKLPMQTWCYDAGRQGAVRGVLRLRAAKIGSAVQLRLTPRRCKLISPFSFPWVSVMRHALPLFAADRTGPRRSAADDRRGPLEGQARRPAVDLAGRQVGRRRGHHLRHRQGRQHVQPLAALHRRQDAEAAHQHHRARTPARSGRRTASRSRSSAKRGGDDGPQVYVIAPDGRRGPARHARCRWPRAALKWSADRKTIYCIAWTWPDTADDEAYQQEGQGAEGGEEQGRRHRRRAVPLLGQVDRRRQAADGLRHRRRDAASTATCSRGTGGTCRRTSRRPNDYDVSPDGKELCFVADSVEGLRHSTSTTTCTRCALDGDGASRRTSPTDNPASDTSPVYSPDGKHDRVPAADDQVLLRRPPAADAARPRRRQAARADRRPRPQLLATRSGCPTASGSRSRPRTPGYVHIYFVGLDGAKPFTDDPRRLGAVDRLRPQATRLGVFLRTSFDRPPTVFVARPGHEGAASDLDHFNDDLVTQWKLGKVENVTFKGADDARRADVDRLPAGLRPEEEVAAGADRPRRAAQRHHERLQLPLEPRSSGPPRATSSAASTSTARAASARSSPTRSPATSAPSR